MDEYLSAVIIAGMTGIFSIITLLIQQRQHKIIDKIDDQTVFIQKEYELKKNVNSKKGEKEELLKQMLIETLKNSVRILDSIKYNNIDELVKVCDKLSSDYLQVTKEIKDLEKEYNLLSTLNEKSKSLNSSKS